MFNKEEITKLKSELLKQIDSWQADDKQKSSAKKKIASMSPKELEEFLKSNNMIKPESESCVFCLIVQGKVNSYKLAEDKDCLAVLEINPLSKGHSMIIPKKHSSKEEIPETCFALATKIAKKIKQELKPQDIEISTSDFSSHGFISIIPDYGTEREKKKADESELLELQKQLSIRESIEKTENLKPQKLEKAPRRLP